jgi:Flp pilus assembly protein TadG
MPSIPLLRRFGKNQRGVSAVEFALIAPMLFAVIFGSIEVGWTMVQTIMLDRALDTTVRALRIGQLVNPTQASVRAAICAEARILADCTNALALEFIPIPPGATAASYPSDAARCVNRGAAIQPVLRFDPGGRTQMVFVRACFVVDPLTPGLGLGLALPQDETGGYRIIAKSGFVNEPA